MTVIHSAQLAAVGVGLVMAFVAGGVVPKGAKPTHATRCADFRTQAEAQSYMEEFQYARLDGDRDRRACEGLP